MPLIPFYLRRPEAILRIPEAIARGLTVEGFIRELKSAGTSYRRTLMLGDWRSAAGIEAKKDLIKYVRKDRIPSMRVIPDVTYDISREYMYKVQVWLQTKAGEPLKDKFVNIMSDVALTPTEVEQTYYKRYYKEHTIPPIELVKLQIVAAFHKIPAPLAEEQ